jgi:hypothetical protein
MASLSSGTSWESYYLVIPCLTDGVQGLPLRLGSGIGPFMVRLAGLAMKAESSAHPHDL